MSDDLKSCPFCGSYDLGSGGDDKVVGYWCKRCEATGPNHYGRYEWNSRADRIEELEASLQDARRVGAEWFEQSKQNHKRATTAEAKLSKAMEALDDDRVYGVITHTSLATLAELKGEK